MRLPEPYDGYLLELGNGGYRVSANGRTIEENVLGLERARAILEEHAGDKPKWLVTRSGSHTALS